MTDADGLLVRALREESGLLVARLARRFGDFDIAEEAVQAAVVEALTAWRRDGPPDNPAAWLQVAASRNALDAVRRAGRQRALAARSRPPAADEASGTDDRLALLFACCHPALAPESRVALTLRAVVGLTTPPDRPGVPGQRDHAGPADRAGEAEDRDGGHLPRRAGIGGARQPTL